MAEIIKEVASFDLDTSKAVAETNKYIDRLNVLQKELDQLTKEGKDVSKVNKEITQTTKQLNAALAQETKTLKGTTGQLEATRNAQDKLNKETQESIGVTKAATTQTEKLGAAQRQNQRGFRGAARSARRFSGEIIGGFAAAIAAVQAAIEIYNQFFTTLSTQDRINKEVAESTKRVSGAFVEEKSALDGAFEELKKVKKEKGDVKGIVDEINKQYKDYLPNLLTEKTTLEGIEKAQKAATSALIKNFAAQEKANLRTKLFGQLFEQIAVQQKTQASETSGLFGALTTAQGALTEEAIKSIKDQIKSLDSFESQFVKTLEDISGELGDLGDETTKTGDKVKDLGNGGKKAKEGTDILIGSLADLQRQLQAVNKLITEQTTAGDRAALQPLADQYKILSKAIAEAKKVQEELLKDEEDATAKRVTFSTTTIKAINATEEVRNKQLANLKASAEQTEIAGLQSLTTLTAARNQALIEAEGDAEKRKQIEDDFARDRVEIERNTQQKLAEIQLQRLQIERIIAQELDQNTAKLDKQIEDIKLKLAELEGEKVKIDVEVDTEKANANIEKTKTTVNDVVGGLAQLGTQITQFLSAQIDAEIRKLSEAISQQKSVLGELLGNQSDANAAQVEAERKRLDKLTENRQKAAERQAVIAQLEIAFNSAVAISQAAAQGGGFASAIAIAATVLSLILGFTQAKSAAAGAFYEGTTFVPLNGNKKGRDTVPAWVNEGEAIIPTQTNKAYKEAVEGIYYKKVDPKMMNDFTKLAASGKITDLSQLTSPLPPSLIKVAAANGVNLNSVDMSGMISGMKKMSDKMSKDIKSLRQELASIPRQTINLTERGLRTVVERGRKEKETLSNKFR